MMKKNLIVLIIGVYICCFSALAFSNQLSFLRSQIKSSATSKISVFLQNATFYCKKSSDKMECLKNMNRETIIKLFSRSNLVDYNAVGCMKYNSYCNIFKDNCCGFCLMIGGPLVGGVCQGP